MKFIVWIILTCLGIIIGVHFIESKKREFQQSKTEIIKTNPISPIKQTSKFSPSTKKSVYLESDIGAYCINGTAWLVSNGGNMSQMLTGDTSTAGGLSVVKCTGGTTLELINGEYK